MCLSKHWGSLLGYGPFFHNLSVDWQFEFSACLGVSPHGTHARHKFYKFAEEMPLKTQKSKMFLILFNYLLMIFSHVSFVWESERCHINAPLHTCLSPGPTSPDIAFRSTRDGISSVCYLSETSYLQVRGAASCCDCCATGDEF